MSSRTIDDLNVLLKAEFKAQYLLIQDQSSDHRKHFAERNIETTLTKGEETTHLKVLIVTSVFRDISMVQRHRQVYKTFETMWGHSLHALQIQAYTPEEWIIKKDTVS